MADDPPRPLHRRRSELTPAADPPSGRWDREYADPEVTPPPVDVETVAAAWHRVRSRVSELHVQMAGLTPALDGLARRVDQLEQKDAEMARSLISVERTQAVQTSMLSTIERGISDLKSVRTEDATRFRFTLQLIAPLLMTVAALAVSIISLITR